MIQQSLICCHITKNQIPSHFLCHYLSSELCWLFFFSETCSQAELERTITQADPPASVSPALEFQFCIMTVSTALGMGPRDSCMLGKYSASWAIFPDPYIDSWIDIHSDSVLISLSLLLWLFLYLHHQKIMHNCIMSLPSPLLTILWLHSSHMKCGTALKH